MFQTSIFCAPATPIGLPPCVVFARFPERQRPPVCARFVELCRKMALLTKSSVAIDGMFEAVTGREATVEEVEELRAEWEEVGPTR